MTAVFIVNGRVFVNSQKIMQLVNIQFYMLYINFSSEHLSVQFNSICFSAVALPMNAITQVMSSCVEH